MVILISENINFDPEKKCKLWQQGTVEIFGQWNNWTVGQRLNIGIINTKFYIFGEIDVPVGTYEYKYKYQYKDRNNYIEEWFNDDSSRIHNNNNQIINTTDYDNISYLIAFDKIPKRFDIINLITNEICTRVDHGWSWYKLEKPSDPDYKPRETMCISKEIFIHLDTILDDFIDKCNLLFGNKYGCWHIDIYHDFNISIFIHRILKNSEYYSELSIRIRNLDEDGSFTDEPYFNNCDIGSYIDDKDHIYHINDDKISDFLITVRENLLYKL